MFWECFPKSKIPKRLIFLTNHVAHHFSKCYIILQTINRVNYMIIKWKTKNSNYAKNIIPYIPMKIQTYIFSRFKLEVTFFFGLMYNNKYFFIYSFTILKLKFCQSAAKLNIDLAWKGGSQANISPKYKKSSNKI